jgi:hypothetical protein
MPHNTKIATSTPTTIPTTLDDSPSCCSLELVGGCEVVTVPLELSAAVVADDADVAGVGDFEGAASDDDTCNV